MLEPTKSETDVQDRWTFTSFDSSSIDVRSHRDMAESPDIPYDGPMPYKCTHIVSGPTARYAAWPPLITRMEKLGYIVDSHGAIYPGDIGRSSILGKDSIILQFGDTFRPDNNDTIVLGASSTAAVVLHPDSHPTVTSYTANEEKMISSFIPLRPEEEGQHLYGKRTTLWCFGGIVEIGEMDGQVAAGWTFYQKGTQLHLHPDDHVFHYTGVAKIFFDCKSNKLSVQRVSKPLVLFAKDEPSFGTFSVVKKGEYAYLFGHAPCSTKLMLARVEMKWVLDRSRYSYWDGKRYQGNLSKAKHVMGDVQHGAIYQSKLFEPKKGRDWILIGSQFYNNKVLIGVSANIEGPYTILELMSTFSNIRMPTNLSTYCVYPHPWAFSEEDGELMITWSEGSIVRGVVAVKLQFAMTMDKGTPSAMLKGSLL